MSGGATAAVTLAFPASSRSRQLHPVASHREPRVARHLALAHVIERRIRAGREARVITADYGQADVVRGLALLSVP
jgi:hypothetical protein